MDIVAVEPGLRGSVGSPELRETRIDVHEDLAAKAVEEFRRREMSTEIDEQIGARRELEDILPGHPDAIGAAAHEQSRAVSKGELANGLLEERQLRREALLPGDLLHEVNSEAKPFQAAGPAEPLPDRPAVSRLVRKRSGDDDCVHVARV